MTFRRAKEKVKAVLRPTVTIDKSTHDYVTVTETFTDHVAEVVLSRVAGAPTIHVKAREPGDYGYSQSARFSLAGVEALAVELRKLASLVREQQPA